MKKTIFLGLILVLIFSLTGCSKEGTLMKNPWEYGGAIYQFEKEGLLKRYVKGVEATGTWSLSEDEKLTFSIDNIQGTYTFDFENKNMILTKPNNETVEWKVYKGDIKKVPAPLKPGEVVPTIE